MPRKLSTQVVRQMFLDAGYEVDQNFVHQNTRTKYRVYDHLKDKWTRISVQQLKYHVAKGNRPSWSELPLPPLQDLQPQTPQQQQQSPLERFINKHDALKNADPLFQQTVFNTYTQVMPQINRKRQFAYLFKSQQTVSFEMLGVVYALKDSAAKILKTNSVLIDLETNSNKHRYFHVNTTTLNSLYDMFSTPEPDFSVQDSSDNMLLDSLDYKQMTFTFQPITINRRVRAGFFPFVNTSTTDLSRYGIYTTLDDPRITEPCIITALKSSGVFTENEMNQIEDMIKVRCFPQSELKHIAELFKVNVYVRHYKANNSTSHIEFNDPTFTRSVKLMIFYEHYALIEQVGKQSSYALINRLIKSGSLRPMTDSEIDTCVLKGVNATPVRKRYSNFRPLVVHIKPVNQHFKSRARHTQYFFGYTPDDDEVEYRLAELQQFVDTLKLRHRIDVRSYFKFSTLMKRIMYEFGCFDDVFELTGTVHDAIRSSLTFPQRVMTTSTINEKCYYLDFNGAYCSFMTHIPTGVDMKGQNTKIKELIDIMYAKRLDAKRERNDKFAKTLKFIMCSCYGSSITRPKLVKHKYSQNVQNTINEYGELVLSHDNSNYVHLLQPYVEHYAHPQFAKVILDGFNNKVNELRSIVNVLFQNFDAFVVNEADYNKLNELGYIHPTELGKLKVEHVFIQMTFKNKCQWIGINEDGTEFRHCC